MRKTFMGAVLALAALAALSFGTPGLAAVTTLVQTDQETPVGVANASVPINVSTSTTTQLVALSAAKRIYVSHFNVIAGGTGTFKFVYGTGSSCGTGTTDLTGAYPLTAQAGISAGDGMGAILVVPSGNALCVTTVGVVQYSGSAAYMQF